MAVDLSWYWWYRRRYPEGVGWQERLLDSAPGDAQLRARALAHIGLLARGYGDVERAQFAVSEARPSSMRSAIVVGKRTSCGPSRSCTSARREWRTLGLLRMSICA